MQTSRLPSITRAGQKMLVPDLAGRFASALIYLESRDRRDTISGHA
jgi:hypothetical protein